MRTIINFIGYTNLVLLLLCCTSCEKYLAVDPPNDKLASTSVFSDSLSASLAISGTYSDITISSSGFLASQVRWGGFSSDELVFSGSRDEWLQFYQNNLSSDNFEIDLNWGQLYKYIYQVNNIIAGIEGSETISVSAKGILVGEAKFIRACLFFYRVKNWGAVPLTLSPDYRDNESLAGSSVGEIYQQISTDLKEAVQKLPASYPTADRARPNKAAATALLARVQLYTGDWQHAADNATLLISSGEYSPLPAIESSFLKASKEIIWQLYPAYRYDTFDAYYFIPYSLTDATIPTYLISEALYNSFEEADQRKAHWIGNKTVGTTSYLFPYKYKQRSKTNTEYTVVLRLAEQYLIRAEARANMDDLSGAIADLNVIRIRAGLAGLPENLTQSEVLTVVEEERRHELFCEWSHRWFDLKRTGRAQDILKEVKGDNWQASDVLWPIPLNQLLANPFLEQNNGY
jgi:hypothetical protein